MRTIRLASAPTAVAPRAALPGRSKTITVEPLRVTSPPPERRPDPEPAAPAREEPKRDPARAPSREPAPAR